MHVSCFYKPQIHATGCQKRCETLMSLTFSQEKSSALLDLKTHTDISVLDSIIYMEKKRKHFRSVIVSTSTKILQPQAVKLEEDLQNTPCPSVSSCFLQRSHLNKCMTLEVTDMWNFASGKILAGCSLQCSWGEAHYSFSIRISAISLLKVGEPCNGPQPSRHALVWDSKSSKVAPILWGSDWESPWSHPQQTTPLNTLITNRGWKCCVLLNVTADV